MSLHIYDVTACSLNELRRDLQNVIGANFNLGPTIENFAGETFLSHEVAINIMQETKNAFKRCQVVGDVTNSHFVTFVFKLL